MAFCIDQSDGVTAVSESLKTDTFRELGCRRDIRVIPNFIDTTRYRRGRDPCPARVEPHERELEQTRDGDAPGGGAGRIGR